MDLLSTIKRYTTEGPPPAGLPHTAAPWFRDRGFNVTMRTGVMLVGSGFNTFSDRQTRRIFYIPLEVLPQVLEDPRLTRYLHHVILWRMEHGI